MGSPLLVGGVGAVFVALLLASLTVLSTGARRVGVTRTVRAAGNQYRVRGATGAGAGGRDRGLLSRLAGPLGRALTPPGALDHLNRRLDNAGNPQRFGIDGVLDYKGLLLFVGAAAGLLVGTVFAGPLGCLVWLAVGAAVGFFAPNLLISHLAQQRQQRIRLTLPDVLDMLVVTVEAGLGFEAGLAQVVHNGRGPMVGEFARVLHEMQIGMSRVDALREMADRTTVGELKAFASAVVRATTLGVPMAKVLRQQSAEMRIRRRQRAEELAHKVPIKILFPMVVCMLPALFVIVIGPGLIRMTGVFNQ